MRTQVAIVGGGPAGALLAHLLHANGVDALVVERQSRDYVLQRIRAGVLEAGTAELLRKYGLGGRMDREGHPHDAMNIAWDHPEILSVDAFAHTGRRMVAYGQTKIQEDLYQAGDDAGREIIFEAADVELHDVATEAPWVSFVKDGIAERIDCDFIAGCDGFHGVSRHEVPDRVEYEKTYPFGWLGIMSETPPLPDLIYGQHERGFALCLMREPMLSRYYVQCDIDDSVDDWSDDRFWDELMSRLPDALGSQIVTGPSIEKSIAPLRSYVAEPMAHGRLYLAGDAAHIVPPTGAKGLNLAVSDVFYLCRAMVSHYVDGTDHYLDSYSDMALRRVWSAVRFSWWLTVLLHRFPEHTAFDRRAQQQDLHYLATSEAAQKSFSEQFVGLPYEE